MDDWVKNLRNKIGHDTVILPHAVTIVIDGKHVLVEERSDDGYIDFPGGTLDLGETIEECAIRELKEETGIIADSLELFKIYTGELTKYTYVNGDDMYGVDVVYLVRKFHGELKPQKDEVNKLEFVKLDDIKGKLSPRNKQIIKDLKEILWKA